MVDKTELKHTPTPWRWADEGSDFGRSITIMPWGDPDRNIDPDTGILPLIALVSKSGYNINGHDNAEFIVRAVNSHDALAGSIETTRAVLHRVLDGGSIGPETRYILEHRIQALDAALQLAQGETP